MWITLDPADVHPLASLWQLQNGYVWQQAGGNRSVQTQA